MNLENPPWEGGCRCGRVRMRISKGPLLTMACHCIGCQHMSASAFSLTMAIPSDGFEITQGETVIGGLHGAAQHHFCAYCMSWLFTRPEGLDWFVNVRPAHLDHQQGYSPFIETYTSEKLPWAQTPAVHSFEKFPAMDAYQALISEFGQAG